jgi:hypothetical protein
MSSPTTLDKNSVVWSRVLKSDESADDTLAVVIVNNAMVRAIVTIFLKIDLTCFPP